MQSGKRLAVEVERLSSLPDDLIYKILSDVDTLYSVRLSVLSSRWRFIWTSMPYLNFSSDEHTSSSRYHEFVNKVLSVRCNNKIDVSSVSVMLGVNVTSRGLLLNSILEYAFSHNVQQLTIRNFRVWGSNRDLQIPPSLLSSKSLKHLKIIGTSVDCHSYWDLPALTTLHLDGVILYKCSSILTMCKNLKNLTLERCRVFERDELSDAFTIINSRLLSLTLKKVVWHVDFVYVNTPQLKNLILVDTSELEAVGYYGRSISALSGVTILTRDLTYLHIKGSYFPELCLDGFCSLEKVDLCISSPQKTNVHKLRYLLQRLHSVKSLALSLEIVELLSTSEEVISHQPSPFHSLKSLKIYPLQGLKPLELQCLRTYPLNSSLEMFPTQLDEEQEAMKIKLSAEATKYLLDSSSNATFTMVSHEEARAIKITKVAQRLMVALWKILEEEEAFNKTKRANVEWKKTVADSCSEDFKLEILLRIDTEAIIYMLHNIKLLLTKVLASKRVEMQACFSRLSAKTKTIVNKILVDMKNRCDIKQRMFNGYLDEIALSS